MKYTIDEIVRNYSSNCEKIVANKLSYINIYKSTARENLEDFNKKFGLSKNSKVTYLEKLEENLNRLEKKMNEDIKKEIQDETEKFAYALCANQLISNPEKYEANIAREILLDTSNYYDKILATKENNEKKSGNDIQLTKEIEDLLLEIKRLV